MEESSEPRVHDSPDTVRSLLLPGWLYLKLATHSRQHVAKLFLGPTSDDGAFDSSCRSFCAVLRSS
jgi:hypothetical protein